jgi:protein arginine N-methyltransferase 5
MSNVVGCLSKWVDIDNDVEDIVLSSERVLMQELGWAQHLGLQAVLMPSPHRSLSPNYARLLKSACLSSVSRQQLWIRMPLRIPFNYSNVNSEDDENDGTSDGWVVWDSLRNLMGCHHKICIAIELTDNLPDDLDNSVARWASGE